MGWRRGAEGLPGPSCHSIVHTTHLFDCAISLRPELRAALPCTSRRSRAHPSPARPSRTAQALLAVGFAPHEFERLRVLVHEEMDAEMVKVTDDLLL